MESDVCSVESCSSTVKIKKRGLCSSHQHRVDRYGSPEGQPSTFISRTGTCSAYEGECPYKIYARGLCNRHYKSSQKYGDWLTVDVNATSCSHCQRVLVDDAEDLAVLSMFSDDTSSVGVRSRLSKGQCEDCVSFKNRSNKALNNYGPEGLAVFGRIEAGEACEVCGGFSTRMAIDHNHKTGKVRGLLCGNCNTALGLLKENRETLLNLLSYMDLHAEDLPEPVKER